MKPDLKKLSLNVSFQIPYEKNGKPATAKGVYFKKVVIKGTMTPGVPLAVSL